MEIRQEKRYRFLKGQIYLTNSEKEELESLQFIKSEFIKEVNERFLSQDKVEIKKEPRVNPAYVGFWLKKIWEFQNRKEFIINADNREVINALCLYFSRDIRFEDLDKSYSLDKGIYLGGFVGVGKTSIFKAIQELGKLHYKEYLSKRFLFRSENCKKIVSDYMDKNNPEGKNISKYCKVPVYFFDDLGAEIDAYNTFNIMEYIIEERNNNRLKSFITSNLNLKQVQEKYGDRVRDRFNEDFNIITLGGKSFRK